MFSEGGAVREIKLAGNCPDACLISQWNYYHNQGEGQFLISIWTISWHVLWLTSFFLAFLVQIQKWICLNMDKVIIVGDIANLIEYTILPGINALLLAGNYQRLVSFLWQQGLTEIVFVIIFFLSWYRFRGIQLCLICCRINNLHRV